MQGEHVLTGVLTQPTWDFVNKFNGCRLLFRNALFAQSAQAYRHIAKTPGITDSDRIDSLHNMGMAMVFMDDPDGQDALRQSQVSVASCARQRHH